MDATTYGFRHGQTSPNQRGRRPRPTDERSTMPTTQTHRRPRIGLGVMAIAAAVALSLAPAPPPAVQLPHPPRPSPPSSSSTEPGPMHRAGPRWTTKLQTVGTPSLAPPTPCGAWTATPRTWPASWPRRGAHRPRRPLLRRHGHHQRRHGQLQRQRTRVRRSVRSRPGRGPLAALGAMNPGSQLQPENLTFRPHV